MTNPINNKKLATTEPQNDSESQNSTSDLQRLQEKVEELESKAQEYLNGWKRAKADYLNREREIEREKIDWVKFANLELILNLLPILDSFEASIKQPATTEAQNIATAESQKNSESQRLQATSESQNRPSASQRSQGSEIQRLQGWVKGILKVKEQLEDFLKSQGVEKIKTIGEKFNPELHEAVGKRGEGGEIIEEVQAGYLMHGQTIRPAKVIIK